MTVVRNDRPGTPDDRGGYHVLIVRVGEAVGRVETLPAFDQRVVERGPHLLYEQASELSRAVGIGAPLDELSSLVELQFFEDRVAPHRPVHALNGQGQQEVALQAWPQHAGIQ